MRKHVFWVAFIATSFVIGCADIAKVNPHGPILDDMHTAKQDVTAAQQNVASVPPKIDAAKNNLDDASKHIDSAITKTQSASSDYDKLADANKKQAEQIKELNDSFWSPRQKHLFWFVVIGSVLLGILAAVGNFVPGWWSLPALFAVKAVRFVIFAGIPHIVSGIVWLVGKMKRKPAMA